MGQKKQAMVTLRGMAEYRLRFRLRFKKIYFTWISFSAQWVLRRFTSFKTPFFAFADDKQVIESEINLEALIPSMERKLEMITKWLCKSGLIVNVEKTEICPIPICRGMVLQPYVANLKQYMVLLCSPQFRPELVEE